MACSTRTEMNGTTVLIVHQEDYPWDVRIDKFSRALTDRGYDVHILCNNKSDLATFEMYAGSTIHRLKHISSSILAVPGPHHPLWYSRLSQLITLINPAVIIVRDLPLCLNCILMARRKKIPVIYDMAENYPEAVRIWKITGDYSPLGKALRNVPLLKVLERICIRYSEKILVVAEESAERLLKYGVANEKIRLVGNTPEISRLTVNSEAPSLWSDDAKVITYVGGFQFHRGLANAIDAMNCILRQIPTARLVLVGDGPSRLLCEKRVNDLTLKGKVIFTGYLPHSDIGRIVGRADVCLIPHMRSEHTNTTIPNKIYEYMCFGKPVVVSDCIPLERIVRDNNCGTVFRSGDKEDLCSKMVSILNNGGLRALGENGRRAIYERYNWTRDKTVLLDTVDELLVHVKERKR